MLALALALLVALLLVRALALSSRQLEVAPAPFLEIDGNALAQSLGLMVRMRTISHQDRSKLDKLAFQRLEAELMGVAPAARHVLHREPVNDLSLLYTWTGRDPTLPPVLLAAHLDVVPVDPASESDWTHPPFEGTVEDGIVWGRGALDDKASLVCLLAAVDRLVRTGFRPERTVYLAFGHDEEVGGYEGAKQIAQLLESRGVELAWVLDEGGLVASEFVAGARGSFAVVGIAEKGSVSIALELEEAGGHSSVPPAHTAIGDLARALVRLERHPMPARIDGVTGLFLDQLAPELPFPERLVLANRWLFGPLIEYAFSRVPALDAMQRTTTALTIFDAGVKENVLPARARAIANFRIHPDDRVSSVSEHVRDTIQDERIQLQIGVRSVPREPSPVSPVDSGAYRLLQGTIRSIFPDAAVLPYLVLGGTDARHYYGLTRNVYRFAPFQLGPEALKLAHGVDERISGENLARAVRFYVELLARGAGAVQSPSS